MRMRVIALATTLCVVAVVVGRGAEEQPPPKPKTLTWVAGHRDEEAVVFADPLVRILGEKERKSLEIVQIVFSPDGRWLASLTEKGLLTLWDVNAGKAVSTAEGWWVHQGDQVLAFSPSGTTISCTTEYAPEVLKVPELTHVLTLRNPWPELGQSVVRSIAFSPDGKTIAGHGRAAVVLWDAESGLLKGWHFPGDRTSRLSNDKPVVHAVAFSPDGKLLAASFSREPSVVIWDPATWQVRATIEPARPAASLAFSPNGKILATAAAKPARGPLDERPWGLAPEMSPIQLWDPESGELIVPGGSRPTWDRAFMKQAVSGPEASLSFSADGSLLATGGYLPVHLWLVERQYSAWLELRVAPPTEHRDDWYDNCLVAFSPVGKMLAMAYRGRIWLWDVSKLSVRRVPEK
jgi:WD40 repeat protein